MIPPIRVTRVPATPIRIERLAQNAPVVRLSGVMTQLLDNGGGALIAPYEASFAAALSWTVNHNLGRVVSAVRLLSPGGVEVEAQVVETSLNQIVVSFASAQAGRVVVF